MNLDDYVSKKENENDVYEQACIQRIIESTKGYKCFYEIEAFNATLDPQIIHLLKEFNKYIECYNFNTTNIKKTGNGTYALAQIKKVNNYNMAALIEKRKSIYVDYRKETNPPKISGPFSDFLNYFLPNSLFCSGSHTISEEEYIRTQINNPSDHIHRELLDKNMSEEDFKKRLSNFQLVGSQDFFALELGFDSSDWYSDPFPLRYAYYSKDGHVFLPDTIAEEIAAHVSADAIGNHLANEAIKIKQKKYPYNN